MFLLLPVGVDYRAQRYPVVTFTLIGLCTAVYLGTLGLSVPNDYEEYPWAYRNLWLIPNISHWWTYLTSLFVHANFLHLLGNMIFLFLFGSCVEDRIGRFRFTIFYLLCGLAGNFAYLALSSDHFSSDIPLGGASGAISGCIGGFLLLLAKTQIEFKWFFWFFLYRFASGEFMLPAWLVISFWFLEDLAAMILSNANDGGRHHGGGVAFAAHVGGTLFGMGLMATRKLWLKEEPEVDEEPVEQVVAAATARVRARRPAAPEVTEPATIFLLLNGAQAGPFTLSHIHQMFALESVPTDSLYWQEGMDDWRPADELRLPGG